MSSNTKFARPVPSAMFRDPHACPDCCGRRYHIRTFADDKGKRHMLPVVCGHCDGSGLRVSPKLALMRNMLLTAAFLCAGLAWMVYG